MSAEDTTVIADLVARAMDLAGDDIASIPFDEICAEHPHLQSDVIEGVRVAMTLPGLHAEGDVDRFASRMFAERYRLGERLGAGAMGVVYEATDLDLGRPVAIKVMQANLLERSTALARFEREAAALAAVQHPSVVTIYDRGVTPEGTPYLAMELVEGVPCSRLLELARDRHADHDDTDWLTTECGIQHVEETSFLRQVMRWAADVASGLAQAHAAGVVHRDVKPSNIIVRPSGKAVLLDFGIAAKRDQESLTQTGAAVGTPAYMAPEALDGSKEARPSQDVYGLAATLYHMLTLQAPYRGTAQEVLASIATREPMPAARIRPGIPRDAQAILDHGLARDPRSRYASLADMESDLRALLAYRPVSVRPTTTLTRFWRRARRSRVALGVALTLAALGLVQGWSAWSAKVARAQGIRYQAAWPALPANLSVMPYRSRVVKDEDARQGVADALEGVVAAGHLPVIAHVLRGTFRADHGDYAGAREDLDRVARAAGTPFARELAARYRDLPVEGDDPTLVQLDDLPAPATADDHYLAALHAYRAGAYPRGVELLAAGTDGSNRHAVALELLGESIQLGPLRSAARKDPAGWEPLVALADDISRRALLAQEAQGYPCATLSHVAVAALNHQARFEAALETAEGMIERSPHSFTILQNASHAALHLGLEDMALEHARRALRINPGHPAILKLEALACVERGDIAGARSSVDAYPRTTTKEASQHAHLLIQVEREVVRQNGTSDPATAHEAAARALAVLGRMAETSSFRRRNEAAIAAILEGERAPYFRAVLADLVEEPVSPFLIEHLARSIPDSIEGDDMVALAHWIESLYHTIAASERSVNR